MKLVVLDVDGVLNSQGFLLANNNAAIGSREQLDPLGCQRVQRICESTGAQILLSSTWRLSEKRPHMQEMLRSRGLSAKIVGYTPSLVAPMGLFTVAYPEAKKSIAGSRACNVASPA